MTICHSAAQRHFAVSGLLTCCPREALAKAVKSLEHPSLAARLTNLVGKPVELPIAARQAYPPIAPEDARRPPSARAAACSGRPNAPPASTRDPATAWTPLSSTGQAPGRPMRYFAARHVNK